MTVSPAHGPYDLPSSWKTERFRVKNAGSNELAFWNLVWYAFVSMKDDYKMLPRGKSFNLLPDDWTQERFKVLMLDEATALEPGCEVGLHSTIHNRFVRMNANQDMDQSHPYNINDFPRTWEWERFMVVLGEELNHDILHYGRSTADWGFHQKTHNRYIKMAGTDMMASPTLDLGMVPDGWNSERFRVVNAGAKHVAIHNGYYNRFIRMHPSGVDCSGGVGVNGLPSGWTWERFKILQTSGIKPETGVDRMVPGATVSLKSGRTNKWCADLGNLIRCDKNGIGAWERFYIEKVPVGNAVAMRGGRGNRWCEERTFTIGCIRNAIGTYEQFFITSAMGETLKSITQLMSGRSKILLSSSSLCLASEQSYIRENLCNNTHAANGSKPNPASWCFFWSSLQCQLGGAIVQALKLLHPDAP